jgi:PIN domain nuclease of toxin-antitoxin system
VRRVVLDTHALLWFVFDDPRLTERAAALLEDEAVGRALSIASAWEMVIKSQLGKLSLGQEFGAFAGKYLADTDLEVLPIGLGDLIEYSALPMHHRDPFDRLIIAQARVLGAPVLTCDPRFAAYGIETIWE